MKISRAPLTALLFCSWLIASPAAANIDAANNPGSGLSTSLLAVNESSLPARGLSGSATTVFTHGRVRILPASTTNRIVEITTSIPRNFRDAIDLIKGAEIQIGAIIETGDTGFVVLQLTGGERIKIQPQSIFFFTGMQIPQSQAQLDINIPYLSAAVRG